jgi:hypothetical protein
MPRGARLLGLPLPRRRWAQLSLSTTAGRCDHTRHRFCRSHATPCLAIEWLADGTRGLPVPSGPAPRSLWQAQRPHGASRVAGSHGWSQRAGHAAARRWARTIDCARAPAKSRGVLAPQTRKIPAAASKKLARVWRGFAGDDGAKTSARSPGGSAVVASRRYPPRKCCGLLV